MSESKSLFGDHHEMADIWARIQAFDQLFMIPMFKPVDSTMQKINPVGCFNLCCWRFVYIHLFPVQFGTQVKKNVYNLSDIWIRDHDVRTYFTGPHGHAKFFTLQAQAIAGFSSCEEANCYPELLRISYNFVQDNICIGQIMKTRFWQKL